MLQRHRHAKGLCELIDFLDRFWQAAFYQNLIGLKED